MVGLGRGPAALRRAARRMGARRASSCASSPASTAMRRRGARRSTPTTPTRESPPRSGSAVTALGFTGGPGARARVRRRDLPRPRPGRGAARRRRARPHHRGRSLERCTPTPTSAPSPSRTRGCRTPTSTSTVGNVPFADVRLHDPRHNPGAHSLHNHFILKSLHLTRPGGLVAVLSSPLHARRRQPGRPTRDERPGGPGRRGQAADRRAPPQRPAPTR